MRFHLLCTFIILGSCFVSQPKNAWAQSNDVSQLSIQQRYQRALNRYEYGDCDGVLSLLAGLTEPGQLDVEDEILTAHRLYAICSFQKGNEERAQQELRRLLFIQPEYEMDPFITPPPIMEIYQRLQKEIASKTKEMEKAREQSSTANKPKTVLVEKVVTRRRVPSAAPFIPFGYAQFENDEPWKAAAFAFTQIGLLTTNIATYWAKKNYLVPGTSYLVTTQEEQQQYEMLQNFQIGSAVMLGGVYLLGVIDGLLNYSKIRIEDQSKNKVLKNKYLGSSTDE